MRQVLPGGRTLREEINLRIAPLTNLNEIARIRTVDSANGAVHAATADQHFGCARTFDRTRNIRFRSSTNVEDSDNFTGAGLYDSFSGCLTDDLDADTRGPSGCDPTEEDERGVFRAIQRVFASFYNENAFIARRLYDLNEDETGMALLVQIGLLRRAAEEVARYTNKTVFALDFEYKKSASGSAFDQAGPSAPIDRQYSVDRSSDAGRGD